MEGGNANSDWWRMEREHPERIRDGSVSGDACQHWTRYREDLADLAALGNTAHRFSVEWARIEPAEGSFDHDALRHYRDVVLTCRDLGMEPVVTLHHFTLPVWLADRGGVRAPDAPELFARYARACAEAFGDAVEWWVTLNEPAVLAVLGHLYGEWPPLVSSARELRRALEGTARMHAGAYRALHEVAARRGNPARVSIAHHERPFRPLDPASPVDRAVAVLPNALFNRWFLRACVTGRLLPPVGYGQRVDGLRGSLDYLGVNYYCEERVRFGRRHARNLFAEPVADPRLPISAFGWSIDPAGFHRALAGLWREFGLPLLVTENGVADDHDELRPRFLVEHLRALCDAAADGVEVLGYLHWTALDNFEWAEGYSKRFGLFAVDRTTQQRSAKGSAALFGQICRSGEVPPSVEASG